jgi:hypothetical protein
MTFAAFTDLWIKSDTYIDKLTPAQTRRVRELCEKFYNAGRRDSSNAVPVAWLTDRETIYFDKEDAWLDCDGFIEPLYK